MLAESKTFCLRILSLENAATSATLANALTWLPPRRDGDGGDRQPDGEPCRGREPGEHAREPAFVDRLAPLVLPHQPVPEPEADVGPRHHDEEGEAELPRQVVAEGGKIVGSQVLL